MGYCPDLSRSVSLKCGPDPVGLASPGNLLESLTQTCWLRNFGNGPSLVFLMHSKVWEPLVYIKILFHFTLITTYILDGITRNLYMTEVKHRQSSDLALIWHCLILSPYLSRKGVLPLSKPVVWKNLNFLKMKIKDKYAISSS